MQPPRHQLVSGQVPAKHTAVAATANEVWGCSAVRCAVTATALLCLKHVRQSGFPGWPLFCVTLHTQCHCVMPSGYNVEREEHCLCQLPVHAELASLDCKDGCVQLSVLCAVPQAAVAKVLARVKLQIAHTSACSSPRDILTLMPGCHLTVRKPQVRTPFSNPPSVSSHGSSFNMWILRIRCNRSVHCVPTCRAVAPVVLFQKPQQLNHRHGRWTGIQHTKPSYNHGGDGGLT